MPPVQKYISPVSRARIETHDHGGARGMRGISQPLGRIPFQRLYTRGFSFAIFIPRFVRFSQSSARASTIEHALLQHFKKLCLYTLSSHAHVKYILFPVLFIALLFSRCKCVTKVAPINCRAMRRTVALKHLQCLCKLLLKSKER